MFILQPYSCFFYDNEYLFPFLGFLLILAGGAIYFVLQSILFLDFDQ